MSNADGNQRSIPRVFFEGVIFATAGLLTYGTWKLIKRSYTDDDAKKQPEDDEEND